MSEVVDRVVCPTCGSNAAADARFCASCGQVLVQKADERRVVTVLFADIVGYTTLAETRDPESVKNLVDKCFERLAIDIAEHGGRVDKIMGDAIIALFGAPIAHEDDAERAVRAALRMQVSLADWATEEGAEALRMRVGVNTGEVLIGGLRAGGDWTAMGDVVNTASRLQTLAEPGTVVVGAPTWECTRDIVRYTPLGELKAKGREAPVSAWVAEEAVAPPGQRLRRADAPIVGRDQELSMLNGIVDAAVKRGRAAAVLIVAEAGMGKTRLVEEIAARAEREHGATVLEGRCVPYGEANVWWPIAEALRASIGAPVGTSTEDTRRACVERVELSLAGHGHAHSDEVERVANGLLHVLGEPSPLIGIDPTRARDEVSRSLVTYMEGWAHQKPIVIVLSDMHWADDLILGTADALLERVGAMPVILLCTARSSLLDRWQPTTGRHNSVTLHLDSLDRESAAELLDRLVDGTISADLRDVLLDRSGGNPFFLEELVTLLDAGATDGEGSRELPHTLRGLVAARLDALPDGMRHVLEDAAILGRRGNMFSIRIMSMRDGRLTESDVDHILEELAARDLFVIDGDKWAFRSESVREVAYGRLTKAQRIMGHSGVGGWIEKHHNGSAADTDRVAHHYATAASLVADIGPVAGTPPDLAAKAVEWLGRAISEAHAGELGDVAIRLSSQALDLADAADLGPAERLGFLLDRARARLTQRELAAAKVDLGAAAAWAEETHDPVLKAKVLIRRGDLEQKQGDPGRSVATLEEALSILHGHDDDALTAEALLLKGQGLLFSGDSDAAGAAFADGLERYRAVGDRRGEGWALQNLAWVAYSTGQIPDAERYCDESMRIFTEIGDMGGLAFTMGLTAFVRYHQGHFAEAEALADRILEEAEGRGDPWALGMMYSLQAMLRLWTGRAPIAIEPATKAGELFSSMGDWYGSMISSGALGRSLFAAGRIDEGYEVLDAAMTLAATVPVPTALEIASANLACGSAQVGQPDRAIVQEPGRDVPLGFTDRAVADGLLTAQRGDAADARRQIEHLLDTLGESPSGYGLAALAIVRAADGDCAGALAAAASLDTLESVTYSDKLVAMTARLLAHARAGDADASDAARVEARAIADGTQDRLAQELLSLAAVRADAALGRPVAPGAGVEIAAASPGWDTAYRLAAGLENPFV